MARWPARMVPRHSSEYRHRRWNRRSASSRSRSGATRGLPASVRIGLHTVTVRCRLTGSHMAVEASKNSGIHLWLVLMKAHRALSRHAMRSIEPSGLGLSDFPVLEVLLNKGPPKGNDIGRRVDLTSRSITTAIDRLEARGLGARGLHDEDRRSRIGRLTPAGRARA